MDKTDHGQDKTDHVKDQNGSRFKTKRTTFKDKTDHAWGIPDHLIYDTLN